MDFNRSAGAGGVPNVQTISSNLVAFTAAGVLTTFLFAPAAPGQLQIFGIELTLAFTVTGASTASSGAAYVQSEAGGAPIEPLAQLLYAIPTTGAAVVTVYPPQSIYIPIPGLILGNGVGALLQTTPITVAGSVNGTVSALVYYTIV